VVQKIKKFNFLLIMKRRKIFLSLLGLCSASLLAGCNNDTVDENSSKETKDSQNIEVNVVKNDNLAIEQNKCVGCGKCARIAPANFEMNAETRKAQVKSNEIANQVLVNKAVASCHPEAISQ
jgi:ferredoxin